MLSSARCQGGFVISLDWLTITHLSKVRKNSIKEYLKGKKVNEYWKVGLNSLQNAGGKRNLEKLKRMNFGADQCWKEVKNHLVLKFKLKEGGCMRTALLNILSQPAVEPFSRTRYFKRSWDKEEHWLPPLRKLKKLCRF